MSGDVIGTDGDEADAERRVVPTELGKLVGHVLHERAVVADEHDDRAPFPGDVVEAKDPAVDIGEGKVRGGGAQWQHRARRADHGWISVGLGRGERKE